MLILYLFRLYTCFLILSVRLLYGNLVSIGLLEVKMNGVWGRVVDTNWTQRNTGMLAFAEG